jgi:RNA-binding protein 25
MQARDSVEGVLRQMSDPANMQASTQIITPYNVPSHLNDLPPEELPEEHRGAVLSEIDKFRQASAARQEEKNRKDRVQELEKRRAAPRGPAATGRDANDRQSYLRPVDFVAKEGAEEEKSLRADERDEQDEQRRSQREKDDLLRSAHDAERRYLDRERNRLMHWEREIAKDRSIEDGRRRDALSMQKLYEGWNVNRQVENNIFYVDRQRWKLMRKNAREREEADDEADRRAQVDEEARAKIEAERFLARQAEDMAAFEAQQRAAGVLLSGEGTHAPLKLKVAPINAPTAGGAAPSSEAVQVGLLGNVEDDSDLTGLRRGKLAHIDLHDTSTGDLSREERKDRVRRDLPKEPEEVFERIPEWQKLENTLIETNYRLLLDKGIVDSIGESVPDMVDELILKVRAHAPAKELIGVVEAVLEEEAILLIEKLWRELLIDTLSV